MTVHLCEHEPRYGIGIDTGGTYTDSVIVDLATQEVLAKAKALTTPARLAAGIEASLTQLDRRLFGRVAMVALSTTLATNSVVEGNGARVGLIMAVPNPNTFRLPGDLPCERAVVIAGAHNHRGEMTVPLAQDTPEQIDRLAAGVDALAVSSYYSIYNPEHELSLHRLIVERTGKPAICAHQLSGAVGMVERATTAILNGRLLPVIGELLAAVEEILARAGITAPLLIVKGDGSMMSGEACRNRPVETVLSGPAASISGACRLSGKDDALVVDMGGTTTDIALVRGGRARISEEGARVGGWRTRVRAVDMWTLGLGGDSLVRTEAGGRIRLGPQRVIPYCCAGSHQPELTSRLQSLRGASQKEPRLVSPRFFATRRRPAGNLSAVEERLLVDLDARIMGSDEIAERISEFVDLDGLIDRGLVIEVGFTPTDLLHCTGQYALWDREAADAGLELLARRAGLPKTEMAVAIRAELDALLAGAIVAKALQEDPAIAAGWTGDCSRLLDRLVRLDERQPVSALFPLQLPLVAVGAPVHAHLPSAVTRLGCSPIIPPHAEVANAYGAVTGKVSETAVAVVRPASPDGFVVLCGDLRQRLVRLAEAVQLAGDQAVDQARKLVVARGGTAAEVKVSHDEVRAPLAEGWGDAVLIELRVTAIASGPPILPPRPADGPGAATAPTARVLPR